MAEQCPLLEQDSRHDTIVAFVMTLTFRNRREGMPIKAERPPPAHDAMYTRHQPMDVSRSIVQPGASAAHKLIEIDMLAASVARRAFEPSTS